MTIRAEKTVKCLILGRDYLMNILGDNVLKAFKIIQFIYIYIYKNFYKSFILLQ